MPKFTHKSFFKWGGGVRLYNGESLKAEGQHVWRLPRSLYAKGISILFQSQSKVVDPSLH